MMIDEPLPNKQTNLREDPTQSSVQPPETTEKPEWSEIDELLKLQPEEELQFDEKNELTELLDEEN